MSSLLRCVDQSEQGSWTRRKTHPYHQAFSRFPTKGKTNEGKDICEPCRAPGVGSNHAGKAFSENPALTLLVGAKKATYMQFEAHSAAHPGQISYLTDIARVNAC